MSPRRPKSGVAGGGLETIPNGIGLMSMGLDSILVGNCYRDRFGAVFLVRKIENGQITFLEYPKTDRDGPSTAQVTLPLTKLVQNLEGQVSCPQ